MGNNPHLERLYHYCHNFTGWKLRIRENEELSQGHTAGKTQDQTSRSLDITLQPTALPEKYRESKAPLVSRKLRVLRPERYIDLSFHVNYTLKKNTADILGIWNETLFFFIHVMAIEVHDYVGTLPVLVIFQGLLSPPCSSG